MDAMAGNEAITALLETFQGCTKRGESATLFLETKNGHEFATLKVKLAARPGRTSIGLARKKSPSTVRRDKARMEKFVQAKTLQETWCPPATSTPSLKIDNLAEQDVVVQALVNEDKLDNVVDKQEKSDEKMPNENDMKMEKAGSQLDQKMIDEIIDKSVAKNGKELMTNFNKINDLLNSMLSDVTGDKKNLEYDISDNLEEAKLWAINQKQSLANKK